MSYYAFFEGWLLLGQPPGCLGPATSFLSLSLDFGALAVGLGCSPFAAGRYHPATASWTLLAGIRSLVRFGNLVGPLAVPVLYLQQQYPRRYLNIFRGEPAITRFDWPFTPIHSSSQKFSTFTGSGLHAALPPLHPGRI